MEDFGGTEDLGEKMSVVKQKLVWKIMGLNKQGYLPLPVSEQAFETLSSDRLVIMMFNGAIRIGVKFPRSDGQGGTSEYADYLHFDREGSMEMMGILDDEEYLALCLYAANSASEIWDRYLSESTEGHLNLFHNREFPTKRDMYTTMKSEADDLAEGLDAGVVENLRERLPIK